MNRIIQGDCLEEMDKLIAEGVVVDAIITDPPYGTTACSWDAVIPFVPMWERLNKLIKPNGAIVLFGSEPFSSALRMSNIKNYKYDWVWIKTKPQRHAMAKKMPLTINEKISVFYSKQPTYNPQMREGKPYIKKHLHSSVTVGGKQDKRSGTVSINNGERYPIDTIYFPNGNNKNVHPTQKPVALLEYLIKTYTNEGDLVLDNCAGSGTTGIACKNLGRNFILIEKEPKYIEIIKGRLSPTSKK